MPDREKVIKRIADYINAADGLTNVQWVLAELDILQDALALLKAQEPVKPNEIWYGGVLVYYQCPICTSKLYAVDRYCAHCGRAVEWE